MNGVVVLTIVVITLPTLLAEAVPHEGCSRQQEHLVKVHQVALAPHVPKGGSTVEISLKCTANARITAGSFQFKVELDDGQDFREDRNLCDVLECPVGPGHINFKTVQHLPNVFIPGTYAAKLRATDAAGGTIFCTRVQLHIAGDGQGVAVDRVLDFIGFSP